MKKYLFTIMAILIATIVLATVFTTLEDFFLPGSQIGQSGNIETPDKCDNCHGGYNQAVEPAFNWRGSMMSQAARDPLFYACLAIANQDAANVGDLCLRCHTPDGWLNGRCIPTDGSALNNNDRQGVQCDFCHKLVKPTPLGVNPFPGNTAYTSNAFGSGTYTQDQSYLSQIIPIPGTTANGMYIADASNAKRGPFTDAVGRHQMFYSPFHSESDICGVCHDVSNPAFTRENVAQVYSLNTTGMQSPTFDLRLMFPVERTYGEWRAGGFYAPGTANHKTCQDCHMKDVTGKGAKMNDAPVRTNLPLHDMTGGNTFTPKMVKLAYPTEVNAAALDAGVLRARNNLQSAATMLLTKIDNVTVKIKVINKTGHKLPTGYPEGRRIWINIKCFDASNNQVFESGGYNTITATLNKSGTKIYECEPGISAEVAAATGLPEGPSYHFAINSQIYFDNRIPPAGFTNDKLIENQSPVVGATYADGQNWDETTYTIPETTARIEAKLYYQTTTKEYVEFLRDANVTNTKGQELYDLWVATGKSAPELMNSCYWPDAPSLTAIINSVTRLTSKQGIYAQANVTVTSGGSPVSGATVSASYTGPTSGTVSGQTNTSGQVLLNTKTIKNAPGTWCFTLTNVTCPGYGYTPNTTPVCEPAVKSVSNENGSVREPYVKAYPNPFTEKVFFDIASPDDSHAVLDIYDMSGRKISTVFDDQVMAAKKYTIEFLPGTKTHGILYYRAAIGNKVFSGKLISGKR